MPIRLHYVILLTLVFIVGGWSPLAPGAEAPIDWPAPTTTSRPWTRWWWHGSAVEEAEISRLLTEYKRAGLAGVEITCLYGVQGNEANNRQYRSPEWIAAVKHTINEAKRLGLGVDLPAGSGWRMGGAEITPELANRRVVIDVQNVKPDATLPEKKGVLWHAVVGVDAEGKQMPITGELPPGVVKVYRLGSQLSGDRVKRPSPGGEGLNINPFWKKSTQAYLDSFSQTLKQLPERGIRAQFHDSFEYEGDFQPEFLAEFARRRGYKLDDHLPAFAGEGDADYVARVKCDYRETLSDLVLEDLVQPWVKWSHEHGSLARNQSHGSPANWLDLYAACDFPETESFGRLTGTDADPLVMKFASSPAHILGKPLVSAETATWIEEHFNETLAQVKQVVDRQILAGVNHVVYQGTCYSPQDAAWPGWLFYASAQLNPQNPIWRDFPALNQYVTRCQSLLQASEPDNDVLLYWPLHDAWHDPRGMRKEVRVHNGKDWLYGQPLGEAAQKLEEAGVQFDYVSDRLLAQCAVKGDAIQTPGAMYKAIVVPKTTHMPLATLRKLRDLIQAGAKVFFVGGLPKSEAGLAGRNPNDEWQSLLADLGTAPKGDELVEILAEAEIFGESGIKIKDLKFIRRRIDGDDLYFLVNTGANIAGGAVVLNSQAETAVIMQPSTGNIGLAKTELCEIEGRQTLVHLAPGESVFVRCVHKPVDVEPWNYENSVTKQGEALAGPWRVDFIEGGPELPPSYETQQPGPWTDLKDPRAQVFAGTVSYSTHFTSAKSQAAGSILDLGEVLGSARVKLNGAEIATLIAAPFRVVLPELRDGENTLEIEVTGVAANRIRDLDRRGVKWRIFEDINLVNIDYKPFDASNWPVRPLGLVGPVTLKLAE